MQRSELRFQCFVVFRLLLHLLFEDARLGVDDQTRIKRTGRHDGEKYERWTFHPARAEHQRGGGQHAANITEAVILRKNRPHYFTGFLPVEQAKHGWRSEEGEKNNTPYPHDQTE